MADADHTSARQRFLDFLAHKRLRLTRPRRAIIETVFGTEQHFTADELLKWAHRRDRSVSRATVYRTLPLLTESGLVREMDLGRDQKLYDPNYAARPQHNHIICQDCGQIFEFENPEIERLVEPIGRALGFSITAHRLQITATCDEFRKRGTCSKRRG
jgi:Fur family transcriptional regulator, ferric uptake regulator